MYEEAALAKEPEEKESKSHMDPYVDIIRLDEIIKKLHTRFKKACSKENDEFVVKIANAIGLMTSKRIEIVFTVLGVEELVKGKPSYKRK